MLKQVMHCCSTHCFMISSKNHCLSLMCLVHIPGHVRYFWTDSMDTNVLWKSQEEVGMVREFLTILINNTISGKSFYFSLRLRKETSLLGSQTSCLLWGGGRIEKIPSFRWWMPGGTHGLSTVTMTEVEQMRRFKKEVIVKRYVSYQYTNKRCLLNTLKWLSVLGVGERVWGMWIKENKNKRECLLKTKLIMGHEPEY